MAPSDDDGTDQPALLLDESDDGAGELGDADDASDRPSESVPLPAEEAAVHVVDPEVDDLS